MAKKKIDNLGVIPIPPPPPLKQKLHKYSGAILKVMNMFVLFGLLITGAFLLWRGQLQNGFNILFILGFYLIFTKLENMENKED